MGYFMFAGPLAMYYAGDYPNAPEQPPFDRDELLGAVRRWQDVVASQIPGCSRWDEGYGVPYLHGNIGLDAFGALMLRISCRINEEECPATIPHGWAFIESESIDRAMSRNGSVPSALVADIWVPSPEIGLMQCVGPAGNQIVVSTLGTLRKDLVAMNGSLWGASDAEILSWSRTYPEVSDAMDVDVLARYAFSIMVQILASAEHHVKPIVVGH